MIHSIVIDITYKLPPVDDTIRLMHVVPPETLVVKEW